MAIITLGALFSNLNDWPGHLLQNQDGTFVITTQTANTFSYLIGAGDSHFPNYRVTVTGSGLQYDADGAIGGTMGAVRIYDPAGTLILTFDRLAANTLASDFSQFYQNVFGSALNGDGPGPDATAAWSHLMSGNDVINGTAGNDWQGFLGIDAGNDRYNMGLGDDFIYGGSGNDTMNGGDGYDVLSYGRTTWSEGQAAFKGIIVNMNTGVLQDAWGGRDVISNFEEVQGSRFNDTFFGSDTQRDRFQGGRGRDTIDGGANSYDATGTIRTEDRRDQVNYDNDYWNGGRRGIIVDLETNADPASIRGTIRDGFGNIDTVIDIERVVGTRFNDVFVGSRMNNAFSGGEGVDSFDGMAGFDFLDFGRNFTGGAQVGAIVDLRRATGQIRNDGFGNVENALNIEQLNGSDFSDRFIGNAQENWLEGANGADTMTGGGGRDYFFWYDQNQFNEGDSVTDFAATGPDADFLSFDTGSFTGMTTTAVVVNGTAATQAGVGTFVFNAINDTLYWDQDGAGGAQAQTIAVLANVASLSAANFDLFD